ncbi:MAG: hypothetical protein ACRYFZ_26430 [Janthinobacterium lividum]
MSSAAPGPTGQLHHASQQLRQQLAHLQAQPVPAGSPLDLSGLLAALGEYEQAVLASLPLAPVDLLHLTPAELRAYREADPVYRLGWVRGHKAGVAQGQRAAEPALRLYAQQAALPAPPTPGPDHAALVAQVRRCLATLHQRYGAGPISPFAATRPA